MKENTKRKLLKLIEFCKTENIDINAEENVYVTVGNGKMQEEVWTPKSISRFIKVKDFECEE